MSEKENDLEKLIRLAHVVAKPYLIAVWVLSVLLLLSVGANVYLATQDVVVSLDANADHQSTIEQNNVR